MSGSPPRPTGTVRFTADGSPAGSCSLPASGDDSCEVTYAPADPGTHAVRASYDGDENHASSDADVSVAVTQQSTPAAQGPTPDGVSISHRNPVLENGKALITVRCRGPRGSMCKGVLVLTASSRKSRLHGAGLHATSVAFKIAAGRSKVLHVRPPRSSLRRVRRLHKAVALATFTLAMPNGKPLKARRAVTLVGR